MHMPVTLRRLAPALPLLLAACSSWTEAEKAPPCPRASIVDGADRVVRFADAGRTPQDVAFEARILGVGGDCEFTEEGRLVTVNMQLRLEGARGPALSGKSAPLPPDRVILEVADEIGVPIDNSCRVGTCGVCRVKLLSGRVTMAVEDGLEPGDKEKNIILACQAKSEGDVAVEA